jgi:hypothetical protein
MVQVFQTNVEVGVTEERIEGCEIYASETQSHLKGDFAMKVSKSKIIEMSHVTEKAPISND